LPNPGPEAELRLQAVRFRYSPELPEVLQGLDLEIRRGERIGLIGSSGSGKSPLVDFLMGLLGMARACTTRAMPGALQAGGWLLRMCPRASIWPIARLPKTLPSVSPGIRSIWHG
jgi:hypothetical protein